MSNIKAIDLFAGAGGLSVGAHKAGLRVVGSIELDKTACDTLRLNSKYHGEVLEADVTSVSGASARERFGVRRADKLIVVGGAPCQPFSKAAYWTEEGKDAAFRRARAKGLKAVRPPAPTKVRPDQRRDLVHEFWRFVEESRADGFVFENVPSLKHPRNLPLYQRFVQNAVEAGFHITEVRGNSAAFGVAQTRERIFVLGARREQPRAPRPLHSIDPTETAVGMKPPVTAGDVLDGLDAPKYFEPEEVVSGRWAAHLNEIPPGWNYKALTAWAGHPEPTFEAETRFWNFLLKLSPSRPSWTLAANPGPWTGPFHWQSRRLRTVEMSALQGFPRGYKYAGTRRERVRQIGNAVPPPMAAAMVRAVAQSV